MSHEPGRGQNQTREGLLVRVYLAGTETQRELLLRRIRDWERTRGATVFTAEAGFGTSGPAGGDHVPAVLEFFDERERALQVVEDLQTVPDIGHIVYWPVTIAGGSSGGGQQGQP